MFITKAQQIKDIVEPIPADQFIINEYGNTDGKSCVLGHIHRALSGDPRNYKGDWDGYGARDLSKRFIAKVHPGYADSSIAEINNRPNINGYTEPEIKDRVMHLINDMIEHGF